MSSRKSRNDSANQRGMSIAYGDASCARAPAPSAASPKQAMKSPTFISFVPARAPSQSRRAGSARRRRLDRAYRSEHVDRNRKDDGRALVARDVAERLQIGELHRLRLAGEHLRRLEELLGRLLLALGVDDLRAPLALGFRLARN